LHHYSLLPGGVSLSLSLSLSPSLSLSLSLSLFSSAQLSTNIPVVVAPHRSLPAHWLRWVLRVPDVPALARGARVSAGFIHPHRQRRHQQQRWLWRGGRGSIVSNATGPPQDVATSESSSESSCICPAFVPALLSSAIVLRHCPPLLSSSPIHPSIPSKGTTPSWSFSLSRRRAPRGGEAAYVYSTLHYSVSGQTIYIPCPCRLT
jgi:hypothetical protein